MPETTTTNGISTSGTASEDGTKDLPVADIGAGPVGLAAAHLLERGLTPLVLEAGVDVAAAIRP